MEGEVFVPENNMEAITSANILPSDSKTIKKMKGEMVHTYLNLQEALKNLEGEPLIKTTKEAN